MAATYINVTDQDTTNVAGDMATADATHSDATAQRSRLNSAALSSLFYCFDCFTSTFSKKILPLCFFPGLRLDMCGRLKYLTTTRARIARRILFLVLIGKKQDPKTV